MSQSSSDIARTVCNRVSKYPRITASPEVIADFCKRWRIAELQLFGSVFRDDYNNGSDIDVMVEFESNSLPRLEFVNMETELSDLLGRPVDIVTRTSVEQSWNYIRRREVLTSVEVI